jgi:glycosyltransferase involved in cell wall biosynthesis
MGIGLATGVHCRIKIFWFWNATGSPLSVPQHTAPKIFFSSTLFTPFIEQDEVILSRHYRMEKIIASGFSALLRIPGAVARADISLSWFGSVYAGYTVFLTKLLRKKSVIIVAGVDASKDKEINYGIWLSPWKARVVRYAFRNADRLLVVDPFLQREAARLAEYDGRNIVNIPFGFDEEEWKPGGTREDMVLTVAACDDMWRMKKKGIDKLFDAARSLPEVRFCLIGIRESLLPEVSPTAPSNMTLIPFVPRSDLLPYYQRAKVYCQPSFTEGLPNTLCEAMLSGCIPVGTIAGGIPTAIGTAGYLVEYKDQQALVGALQRALASPAGDGLKARERIASEFTLQKREQALRHVIDGLCG